MAGRRLTLRRYEVQHVNYLTLGAFRLRVEASDPDRTNTDANVFLYLKRPPNPHDGAVDADFHAVASPVDMAEYPVGEPSPIAAFPFFRLNYFELDFRNVRTAEEAWTIIIADVNNLLIALNELEGLTPTAEVVVGASAPPMSGSSGSSLSR